MFNEEEDGLGLSGFEIDNRLSWEKFWEQYFYFLFLFFVTNFFLSFDGNWFLLAWLASDFDLLALLKKTSIDH